MERGGDRILVALRTGAGSAGLFVDFDGTLSDIAPRPDLAQPVAGALGVLSELTRSFALVAVVSGRPPDQIRSLLPVEGLAVFGQYGLEGPSEDAAAVEAARPAVVDVAAKVSGAWVEDKGVSLAVHYRAAPDPAEARRLLSDPLGRVALRHGLFLLPGKMVIELAPSDTPGKGSVILREVRSRRLSGCLYAGDDQADLGAFAALDELRARGLVALKVAVRSSETPTALTEDADVVAPSPAGLVELLRRLAPGPAARYD
jgi:trehalose 6-phosphate phosphatase